MKRIPKAQLRAIRPQFRKGGRVVLFHTLSGNTKQYLYAIEGNDQAFKFGGNREAAIKFDDIHQANQVIAAFFNQLSDCYPEFV